MNHTFYDNSNERIKFRSSASDLYNSERIKVIAYLFSLFGLVLLLWSYKNPFVALSMISAAAIINIWNVVLPYVDFGLKLYIFDGVFIIIFLSGLARHLISKDTPRISILFSIFAVIFFAKFFGGIAPYGTASGVEFRQYFYCFAGALYFSAFSYSEESLLKLLKVWVSASIIVLCIVYYRFVAEYLGLAVAEKWIKADSGDIRFRVIAAADALILAITTIALMVLSINKENVKFSKKLIVLFILSIVALQHRSVWMATFIPIFLIPFVPGIQVSRAFTRQLTAVGISFLCLFIIVEYSFFQKITQMVHLSASRATNLHEGTFYARTQSWEYLLAMWSRFDSVTQFFGTTFGSGYSGLSAYPHNYTLQLLFRGGILSVVVFYFLYGALFVNLTKKCFSSETHSIYYPLFILLLISQLVFYIPYAVSPYDGIILGMAISLAKGGLTMQEESKLSEQDNASVPFKNLLS